MNKKVLLREMKVKEIEEIESKSGKYNFVRVRLCIKLKVLVLEMKVLVLETKIKEIEKMESES